MKIYTFSKMYILSIAALLFLAACAAPQERTSLSLITPAMSAQGYFNDGFRLYNRGDFQGAIEKFRAAIDLDRTYVEAYYYLGMSYERTGNFELAERALLRTVQIDSRYLKGREALGMLYYVTKNYRQAVEHLEIARSIGTVSPNVYFAIGEIYRVEGKCRPAVVAYQKALDLDSGFLDAKEGLRIARNECPTGGRGTGSGRRPTGVKTERTHTGGAAAIDPADF